jgi:hypothetical protein
MVKPWESLAGFNGPAAQCVCSDHQLAQVGCNCDAEQNLPVACKSCGEFLRDPAAIAAGACLKGNCNA